MKYTKQQRPDSSPTDVVIEARRNTAVIPEAARPIPTSAYDDLQPNDVVLPDVSGTNNHGGNVFYRSAMYQTVKRLQILCKNKEEVLPNYRKSAERLVNILRKDRKARILYQCKNNQYREYETEKAVPLVLEDMLRISQNDHHLETSKQQLVVGKKNRDKAEDDMETTITATSSTTSSDTTASNEAANHSQQSDVALSDSPVAPAASFPNLSTLSPRHQYALQLIQKLTNAWQRQRQQHTAQAPHQSSLCILINTIWADELLSVEETLEQSRVRWQLRQRYVTHAAAAAGISSKNHHHHHHHPSGDDDRRHLPDITRRLLQHWKLPETSIVGLQAITLPPQLTSSTQTTNHQQQHQQPSRPASKPIAHKAKRNSSNNAKYINNRSRSSRTRHSLPSNGIGQQQQQQQQQHAPPPSDMPASPGRTRSSHQHDYEYNSGPLTAEERLQFFEGILQHGVGNWSVIAQQCVPTRSRSQLGGFGRGFKDMSLEQVRSILLGTEK